jgi:hypothetical protein
MKRVFPFWLLFFGLSCQLDNIFGQSPMGQIGGRALAVSGCSVSYSDVWSQYHNQAGLARLKGINIGVGFQNEFLIKELSTKSIAFALPLKSGVFGLNYCSFGYSAYNENKFGLAFARNFGKKLAVGIQIDYIYTHIDGEYGNSGIAAGEIGLLLEPFEKLLIGVHLNNIWRTKRSANPNEYCPCIFKLGTSYQVHQKALLCFEIEKDLDADPVFKTGIEIQLSDIIGIRAGISNNPNTFSFGPAISLKSLQLSLAFTKHPILGFSQGISLVYHFKNRI